MIDSAINLIVYDFDGVMTDNRAILDQTGAESVIIHRGDGYGVRMIKDNLHISQIILSTEENPIVANRAEKLHIPVIHGVQDKKTVLEEYCEHHGISLENVLYVGNDLNDYEAMKLCGITLCPADAEPEILNYASTIIPVKGGAGVIRYLYRMLSDRDNEASDT